VQPPDPAVQAAVAVAMRMEAMRRREMSLAILSKLFD